MIFHLSSRSIIPEVFFPVSVERFELAKERLEEISKKSLRNDKRKASGGGGWDIASFRWPEL
jgi:hypothetical protein